MFNLINRSNPKTLSQYNSIELLPAKRRRRRRRGGSLSWTFIWRGKNGKSCCFIFHPDYIPPSHRSILNNRDQFSYRIRRISSSSSFFFLSSISKRDRKKSTNFSFFSLLPDLFSFRLKYQCNYCYYFIFFFNQLHYSSRWNQHTTFNATISREFIREYVYNETRRVYNLGEYLMDYSKRMSECITATYNCSRDSNRSHPAILYNIVYFT